MDKKLKNQKQFQLLDKISNDSKLNDIMTVLGNVYPHYEIFLIFF